MKEDVEEEKWEQEIGNSENRTPSELFNTINELLSFVGKNPKGYLYNGLYGEAMPKRGTFVRLQI